MAVLKLVFKNGELLKLLKKRGKIIGEGNFEKLTEIEQKLNNFIEKNQEDLKTPICAFVTFNY